MKTHKLIRKRRTGFTLVELLVVIAIIATLAGLSYGPVLKQISSANRTEAISNARSINAALVFFYADHDRNYPNEITDRSVNGVLTANAIFQQLIDNSYIDDEKFFWNKNNARAGLAGLNQPVNDGALAQDENVWNYVLNIDAGSGNKPLFFDSNTEDSTFTAQVWDGRAIIARVDGSVIAEPIDFAGVVEPTPNVFATGPVLSEGGLDILGTVNLPAPAVIVRR